MASKKTISATQVETYETLVPLIESLHRDLKDLSRKSQNQHLSKPRVEMINRLLNRTKGLLKEEASSEFLDALDEDLLPQNADAMIVLGQYKAALDRFKERYTEIDAYDEETWKVRGR